MISRGRERNGSIIFIFLFWGSKDAKPRKKKWNEHFSFLIHISVGNIVLREERSQTPAQIQIIQIHVTLGRGEEIETGTHSHELIWNSAFWIIIISKAHTHTHTHTHILRNPYPNDLFWDNFGGRRHLWYNFCIFCLFVWALQLPSSRMNDNDEKRKKDDLAKIGPHPTTKSILSFSLILCFLSAIRYWASIKITSHVNILL